jgi:uncharacterized protein YndB with AHSA1/START domain
MRVCIEVEVDPHAAFAVFTRDTDLWWGRGPMYRFGGAQRGVLAFGEGVGGALRETFADGTAWEVGQISVWEPGARLVFTWRIPNFAPGESTEVEVRFTPTPTGTLVALEHRGWSSLRPDHPALHGQSQLASSRAFGMWWGKQLSSLRARLLGAQRGP